MTMMTKLLIGGAGLAALAAAAPSSAQYAPYGYTSAYGYPSQYGYAGGYGYNGYSGDVTAMATQQCAAAVQNRLSRRSSVRGIIGAMLGGGSSSGRVLGVTQATPRGSYVRVRGLASSGNAGYGAYGAGAYGALGYAYQPDLSFRCDVDYRGAVRDLDIRRR